MREATDAAELRGRLRPMRPRLVPEIVIHAASSGSRLGELAGGHTPYWAYPWPGGCLLARYVLDNPGRAAGRRALDLGSGCGIVAIAAAKAGAAVTAVDCDALAATAIGINAEANGVELTVDIADLLGRDPPAVDLVLAGDLFYERRLAKRATGFLDRCHSAGIDILVGDVGRAHLPRDRLRPVATCDVADFGSTQLRTGTVFGWAGPG